MAGFPTIVRRCEVSFLPKKGRRKDTFPPVREILRKGGKKAKKD